MAKKPYEPDWRPVAYLDHPKGFTMIDGVLRPVGYREGKSPAKVKKRRKKRIYGAAPKSQRFEIHGAGDYQKYLRTRHWRKKRVWVARKARGLCAVCEKYVGKRGEVHHLNYDRLWEEQLTDLLLVCRSCHELEHFGVSDDSLEAQHLMACAES